MNLNSDGLSPSLRAQLGVGWNRSLPSAFGFDNGFIGDSVNDNLFAYFREPFSIPLNGFAVEFWFKQKTTTPNNGFAINFNDSNNALGFTNNTGIISPQGNVGNFPAAWVADDTTRRYARWDIRDSSTATNGNAAVTITLDDIYAANTTGLTNMVWPYTLNKLVLGRQSTGSNGRSSFPIDEFRVYNKVLTKAQGLIHYNGRAGENPSETEFLLMWYKFEQFEMLDFSVVQDGSDMRLGIRDYSGKNNHAQVTNADTNPQSPTYVLKPF